MVPVGSHVISGFDGTRVTKALKRLIQKYRVGGFIFFTRNIESPKQLRELIRNLQGLADYPLLFAIDQEGGRVFRLKKPFTEIPPMAVLGRYYQQTRDGRLIQRIGEVMARELRVVGINWDLAPVVDVHSNPKNPIIGDRAFSFDPHIVSVCAAHLIRGLRQGGVLSCVKHFPGHGATSTDSHKVLPIVNALGRLLWRRDMAPYKYLVSRHLVDSIMTAHVLYPEWDTQEMATLSEKIIAQRLRGNLGYGGVVVSDDLHMRAIQDDYSVAEACIRFFEVSGDLVLICRDPDEQIGVIERVITEVGGPPSLIKLLRTSDLRLRRFRKKLPPPLGRTSLRELGHPSHRRVLAELLDS